MKFQSLPLDLSISILEYLDFAELTECKLVSKYMYLTIFEHPRLFKELLLTEFADYKPLVRASAQFCEEKMRRWSKKQFHWCMIGSTTQCSARYLHRSAPLPDGGCVFFGGQSNEEVFYGIWVMQLKNQTDITFTGVPTHSRISPPATAACAACSVDNSVYVFGGRQFLLDTNPFCNDLWCLDMSDINNVQWEKLDTRNSPPPRWGHTLQLYRGHLILFGGSRIGATYSDVWVLDIRTRHASQDSNSDSKDTRNEPLIWRQVVLAESDPAPVPRGGHSAVVMKDLMYIFGGNDLATSYGDMWVLDLEEVLSATGVPAAYTSSLEPRAAAEDASQLQDADPSFSPPSPLLRKESRLWREVNVPEGGIRPSDRIGHCAVSIGSRYFILYGGRDYIRATMSEGVYIFDTHTLLWTDVSPPRGIEPRTGHCCFATSVGVVFFGGLSHVNGALPEVALLDMFGQDTPTTSCLLSNTQQQSEQSELDSIQPSSSSPTPSRAGGVLSFAWRITRELIPTAQSFSSPAEKETEYKPQRPYMLQEG